MSTSAAAPRREWWPAFGHHAWKIQMAAIVGVVLSFPLGTVGAAVRVPLLITVILGMMAQRNHDRKLCEPCIADMPLNPQHEVQKHRRALRAAHSLDRLESKKSLLVASVAFVVAVNVVIWFHAAFLLLSGVIGTWVFKMHGRLQPWCPQCRGKGGGDDTFNPDPTPTPSREKDLTQ